MVFDRGKPAEGDAGDSDSDGVWVPKQKALSTHRQAQAEAMQTDSWVFWASFPDGGNHSHTQHTPVQHTSSPAAITNTAIASHVAFTSNPITNLITIT
jgi:hypothetical protein